MKHVNEKSLKISLLDITIPVFIILFSAIVPSFVNLPIFFSEYNITKLVFLLLGTLLSFVFFRKYFISIVGKLNKQYLIIGFLMIILAALSILFSDNILLSLFGKYGQWEFNLITYLAFTILGALSYSMFFLLKEFELGRNIYIYMFLLVIAIGAVMTIGEYYLWRPDVGYHSSSVYRASLGFRNPLFAGYLLGILWNGLSAFIVWVFSNPEQIKKSFHKIAAYSGLLVLFTAISLALILTYTRSAWIASTGVFLVTALYLFFLAKNKLRFAFINIVLILIVSILVLTLESSITMRNADLTYDSQTVLEAISRTTGGTPTEAFSFYENIDNYSSSYIRIQEWIWGARTIISNPKIFLFGTGPDSSTNALLMNRPALFNDFPVDSYVIPQYIRNIYIQIALMHGIPFLLFILIGIFLLLKKLFLGKIQSTPELGIALGVFLSFLAQGVFYFPTISITALFIVIMLGYLALSSKLSIIVSEATRTNKLVITGIFTIILIFTGTILIAEHEANFFALYIDNPEQQRLLSDTTIPINDNLFKRYYVTYYLRDKNSERFLDELANSKDTTDLRLAASIYYIIAKDNNIADYAHKSLAILEKISEIDRTQPSTWDEIGLRYLFLKEYSKSIPAFEKAISLKEDYWYSYIHLGEVYRQICKPEVALEWYEKVQEFLPSAIIEIGEAKDEIENPREGCEPKRE